MLNGYSLVLPPGWARVPLRSGTDAALTAILDRSFSALPADLPRDRVTPYRRELERRLRELVAKARDNAGLDLYLPVERMRGFTAPASFLVAEVSFGSVQQVDPAGVLATLIGGDASMRPVTVGGAVGARAERVAEPDPRSNPQPDPSRVPGQVPGQVSGQETERGSRRVDYILPVPDDPDRWVIVSFSTMEVGGSSGDLSTLLTELFDAVMTTFRWQQGPGTDTDTDTDGGYV